MLSIYIPSIYIILAERRFRHLLDAEALQSLGKSAAFQGANTGKGSLAEKL